MDVTQGNPRTGFVRRRSLALSRQHPLYRPLALLVALITCWLLLLVEAAHGIPSPDGFDGFASFLLYIPLSAAVAAVLSVGFVVASFMLGWLVDIWRVRGWPTPVSTMLGASIYVATSNSQLYVPWLNSAAFLTLVFGIANWPLPFASKPSN